jgi:4-amino-4-deoxy-L-arabinose transferase-like glycosyltransferase
VIARWPLLARPFSSEGEAREAHVVADVVREGHWIAPYPNGDWIPTKGPLLYWWAGAAASVFGLSERVLRLSVAALNLCTLFATAWLARSMLSPAGGWLAAAMLATCFLFSGYAFYLRVDPALVACTTTALAAFAWGLAEPRRERAARLVSHVALAGALFAKGIPALIPTLLPIFAVLAWRRDAGGLRTYGFSGLLLAALAAAKLGAAASALCLVAAGAVAALPWLRAQRPGLEPLLDLVPGLLLVGLVGGWIALADARYPVPYLSRVVDDSLNRVGQTAFRGDPFLKPPWFYLPRFPADFLPWSVFLPAALVAAVHAARRDRRDLTIVSLVCLVGGFAIFSAVAYKRKVYLLPLFPAAAVLVASLFERSEKGERALDWTLVAFAVTGIAAVCFAPVELAVRALRGTSVFATSGHGRSMAALRERAGLVDLALVSTGLLWASARWLAQRRGNASAGLAIALGMAVLLAGPVSWMELARDKRTRTPDRFAQSVREIVSPSNDLRFAPGVRDEGLLYYLARRVPATSETELTSALSAAPPEGFYLIARRARDFASRPGASFVTLARGAGSNGPLVLLHAEACKTLMCDSATSAPAETMLPE